MLQTTHLERALKRLKEGWARYLAHSDDEQLRDGLIQRFEFTYEISHKIIKRYLELTSPSPDLYDRMDFADIIRSASEKGILEGDWRQWKKYRDRRNLTSHTYNETNAEIVVEIIPEFIEEVEYFLRKIK
ncbi:HI0074 family nucleotidyltransferase substrate-binding subunit [Zymomonas mobilis]|uniref:Nucleotidyltransferase substrate binding protein, HI0074 family n=1 Tax=Zymomonas mobilis subsp. mobilis (strain ATCC 10988 / DSM 424 / LMG 404 / NCIMB 8938 / NRRL B-806 / ZM1) TaxID=555217 RepID=A0A0H3G0Q1_ZYMMA|nr:HI0074 family nucleotidyltransferase substrate-binding subunit [Zymomonas mobilis]AEH63553.1 nucleotidyltransferase substrate binding protein, HI0074 family [Zymomonas mobilis subsp. mobilis ATCC 10988]TQL26707.1 nucleotidyltransferase substrate binding protein (TIGR01987 family) [Zymomonas mobilis]